MNQSDYEKLKEQGYTEEQIEVLSNDMSRLTVFPEPLGEDRDDRGVVATDTLGNQKRTSSIMMGYNRKNIQLENGDYVSWEEVKDALETTFSQDGDNITYIAKKTGKTMSPPDLIEGIFQEVTSNSSYLSQTPTDKIKNQTAKQMTIHDGVHEYNKGISMFGNDALQLPNGEYVLEEELKVAVENYVKMKPKEPVVDLSKEKIPVPPTPPEHTVTPKKEEENTKKQEEVYRVIQRIYHKMSFIPPILTAATILLSGFGNVEKKNEVMRNVQNLGYRASVVDHIDETFETSEKAFQRLTGQIETGKDMSVPEGVDYHASSDYQYGGANAKGTFGTSLRKEGDYHVDGFSVLHDGKIVKQEWQDGQSLSDTLKITAERLNVPVSELQPMLHLGGPVSGWVNAGDLFDQDEKTPQLIDRQVIIDQGQDYQGTIKEFQGDSITIEGEKGEVTLKIKNEDGTLLQDGSIVTGSDGQQYRLSDLSLEEAEILDLEKSSTESTLNWSIHNMNLEEVLAIASAGAIATYLSAKKKRKEMVDMTGSEIDALTHKAEDKYAYETAEGRFVNQSAFHEAVETITNKTFSPTIKTGTEELRDSLIGHDITVEDIEHIEKGGARK